MLVIVALALMCKVLVLVAIAVALLLFHPAVAATSERRVRETAIAPSAPVRWPPPAPAPPTRHTLLPKEGPQAVQ